MKQIKSYEDYLITLDGKLFSLKSMRFLSLHNKTKAGYPRAELFNEDGSKWHLIHRLVAEAAFVIGCKPTTLKAKLNGQNKNLTTFKYV
jgi:hypothetical protein